MNTIRRESSRSYSRENIVWPPRAHDIISKTHIEEYAAERIFVPKGKHLVIEGAESRSVFLQLTGWTSVECVSDRGERVLVDFLISGDFIGLEDEGDCASCTVTALTDVAVLRIERSQLRALIEFDTAFRNAYVGFLQGLSVRARRHRLTMSSKSATAKVCRMLMELAERIDEPQDEPVSARRRVRMPISQVLLACAVGLTPVAVNRIVQALRRAAVLDWDVSGVSVLAPDRLREYA